MQSRLKTPRLNISEGLLWIARGLVCLLLLIAPWPYGMADWSSQQWLVPAVGLIVGLSAMVAIARNLSVGSPALWGIAAILVVGMLQVVPLPNSVWSALSASARFEKQILELAHEFGNTQPLATAAGETLAAGDGPTTISIHPLQTRTTLCVIALGLAMFLSAHILFRDKLSLAIMLGCLALSGLLIAVLGIYQAVVAGDWTFLQVPKASSFATFYSRNSAPQFLACAFAATGGLLVLYRSYKTKTQRDSRYQISYPSVNLVSRLRRRIDDLVADIDLFSIICLLAMALQMIGIMTANSRGGILAFFLSGCAATFVYALGKQASASSILGVLLLILCSGLFLSSFELDEIIGQRLNTVSEEAYRLNNARLELWKMALSQPTVWLLGSGLGTFHFAILPSYEVPQPTWFYHAENIFVELASNAGFVTLFVVLLGGFWLLWQLLSNPSQATATRAIRFAALFALLAVGLQNLVDFSLILPAVFLPLACLTGAFLGTYRDASRSAKRRRHRHHHPSGLGHSSSSTPRQRHAPGKSRLTSLSHGLENRPTAAQPLEGAVPPAVASRLWVQAPLLVCLLLIVTAVALGLRPLAAFAYSERMQAPPELEELAEYLHAIERSPLSEFPEVRLRTGRFRQQFAADWLKSSPQWPAEINEVMRDALSRPEFFSAVFHVQAEGELQQLRDFIAQQGPVITALQESQADMASALAACALDWRGSWGTLRADLGELTPSQRRLNYARVLLSSRNNQPVLEATGSHALIAGETEAGLRIWRELLPVSGMARVRVLNLLDRFLTIEQIIDIFPTNQLQRIELARRLQPQGSAEQLAAVLDSIDIEQVSNQARRVYEWQEVAWAAAMKGDSQRELTAWHKAALADPLNHRISYTLALALQRNNQVSEARAEIQRAISRDPTNLDYKKLLAELDASHP